MLDEQSSTSRRASTHIRRSSDAKAKHGLKSGLTSGTSLSRIRTSISGRPTPMRNTNPVTPARTSYPRSVGTLEWLRSLHDQALEAEESRKPPTQKPISPRTTSQPEVSREQDITPVRVLPVRISEQTRRESIDEDDATLEELRAQARVRGRRNPPNTLDYWRQIRHHLTTVARKKVSVEVRDSDHDESFKRFAIRSEDDDRLIKAVRENNTPKVIAYLEAGANPHATTDEGATVIHIAAEHYALETLRVLLEIESINISQSDCFGHTPLHCAVNANNWKATYMLVLAGADLDKPDAFGKIPLHYAVLRRNVKIVKMLVYYGSDPNTQDCFGASPLTLVFTTAPIPDIARTLLNAAASVEMETFTGIHLLAESVLCCNSNTRRDSIRALLDSGVNTNRQEDVSGMTPLHFAALSNDRDLTFELLQEGADPGVTNYSGDTPLDTAFMHRSRQVASLLRNVTGQRHESTVSGTSTQTSIYSVGLEGDFKWIQPRTPARDLSAKEELTTLLASRRWARRRFISTGSGTSGQSKVSFSGRATELPQYVSLSVSSGASTTSRVKRRSFGEAYMAIVRRQSMDRSQLNIPDTIKSKSSRSSGRSSNRSSRSSRSSSRRSSIVDGEIEHVEEISNTSIIGK